MKMEHLKNKKILVTLVLLLLFLVSLEGKSQLEITKSRYKDPDKSGNFYYYIKSEKKDPKTEGTKLLIYYVEAGREEVIYDKRTFDRNGMLDGEQYRYNYGELSMKVEYKHGIREGKTTSYDHGRVFIVRQYKNGKVNGVEKGYFKNGSLRSTTEYKNGKRDGVYKSYDNKGRLFMYETYSKGERITAIWYYGDGSLMYKVGIRKNGDIFAVGYYEDGSIKSRNVGNVKKGKRVYRSFYYGGKIKKFYRYLDGKKEGARERYNKDGKIIEIKYYHKDKEISKREYEKLNIKK